MIFKSLTLRSAVLFLLLAAMSMDSQGAPTNRSREEFAAAMSKIEEGTSESQVLALLGKPDDIRTEFDPGGVGRRGTKEIWCYGSKGHLGFATLGCVYIDKTGRSLGAFGSKGQPPKAGLFEEGELRELLRLLDTAPEASYRYNPLPMIRVVNALQPLGKEKALAAMGEYLRVSDPGESARSRMILTLRILFDLPDDIDRRGWGSLGEPRPAYPKNPAQIPHFPMALVDDIPINLAGGYAFMGAARPMKYTLEFYRANGSIRPRPLMPTNEPLVVLDHLMKSSQWIYADPKLQDPENTHFGQTDINDEEEAMVREELLRLIDSVYRLPADLLLNGTNAESAWQKIVGDVAVLRIEWDPKQNQYVFRNGTHLPEIRKKIYRRAIWKLSDMGYDEAELVLERQSNSSLYILVSRTEKTGASLRTGSLSVFVGDDKVPPLLTFAFTNKVGRSSSTSESDTMSLKAGTKLRAKLVIDGYQTNWSPVFKP